MTPSIWQLAIVAILIVLLFGRGKIAGLMGEVAQGIKGFKRGMAEDAEESKRVDKGETIDVTPGETAKKES